MKAYWVSRGKAPPVF